MSLTLTNFHVYYTLYYSFVIQPLYYCVIIANTYDTFLIHMKFHLHSLFHCVVGGGGAHKPMGL